jgi:hypothetical protein
MGFAAESSRNIRRISGGKVMVPRLETGIAVMLQYCNATLILSSANFHREANSKKRLENLTSEGARVNF